MPYIENLGLRPGWGEIQETFLMLRPFKRALTCSNLIAKSQVMLRKAYFLRTGSTDPKFQTVLLRSTHQRTYVRNFSCLGAIPADRYQTDGRTYGRHNDFSRAHFKKICSQKSDTLVGNSQEFKIALKIRNLK
jgi:hypothetical protein